ncbi:MAG: hypothetical protein IJ087_14975 [Eggerthellaceae bacterium]|nr:hypothetical protein [Eggerthellaceae bacterium]
MTRFAANEQRHEAARRQIEERRAFSDELKPTVENFGFGLCWSMSVASAWGGMFLWISARDSDSDQPMFQDVPSEHELVYRNALRESVVLAAMVGARGFAVGAIWFITVTHQSLLSEINILSMTAVLVVALAFIGLWQVRNIKFDLLDVYRVLFPIAATCLLLLPFAGQDFTNFASASCYACFTIATMIVVTHCCQCACRCV